MPSTQTLEGAEKTSRSLTRVDLIVLILDLIICIFGLDCLYLSNPPIILIEVVAQASRLPGSDACTSPTGIGFSDQHMFTTISGTNTVNGMYYTLVCTVKSI